LPVAFTVTHLVSAQVVGLHNDLVPLAS